LETKGVDMPSKEKCKSWKKMGYKSMKDCTSYGQKKTTLESQQEKLMEKQTGKDSQRKHSA
jgi:hypothetical protein